MSNVTVYTTPSCQQCRFTKHWLDKHGVDYDVVDLSRDTQALDAVREMGYGSAPVVFASPAPGVDVHWYGYRPDLLEQHTTTQEEAA